MLFFAVRAEVFCVCGLRFVRDATLLRFNVCDFGLRLVMFFVVADRETVRTVFVVGVFLVTVFSSRTAALATPTPIISATRNAIFLFIPFNIKYILSKCSGLDKENEIKKPQFAV